MAKGLEAEHFDIHASVVFQLGESLITDSVQALVELVKNSYDADASYCKLSVSTEEVADPNSPFRGAIGSITIEDDGTGMTLDDIRRGWLTISNSQKRDLKNRKLTTSRGRTPLGDKGLGRLGTQRLGYDVEIFTRTEGNPIENHIWFSWKDFLDQARLSEVGINREERTPTLNRGTKLIVSQLREPALWKGEVAVKDLETSLSQLISPYKEVRDFNVYAAVDGKELELVEIGEKLRQFAQVRYKLDFTGDLFRISGQARLSYIKPEKNPDDNALFEALVESDGGEQFFKYLSQAKRAAEFSLEKMSEGSWFVGYKSARHFDEFAGLELVDGRPANPGPFRGEVDFFSLGSESTSEQTVFSTAAEYKQIIGKLSGIKVFRDGFGIRVAPDWLDLGKQWTKGGSYYGLKPHNTLGYIALSAKDNRQLEETTDREGFKNNAYYWNWSELLNYFVKFSGNAQAFLRRGWIEFRKSSQREAANVPPDAKPEALSSEIKVALSKAARHRVELSQVYMRLRKAVDETKEAFEAIDKVKSGNGDLHRTEQAISELTNLISEAGRVNLEVQNYLAEVARLESVGDVLTTQIETLREQIQQVHEIIGLGLTAEALSHEISNVTSQLAQRNQQLVRHLRSHSIRDVQVTSFTEYVNTSVASLRRQLLFLAPSLRYVREKRETIDMESFVDELFKHYTKHFSLISSAIGISTKGKKGQNFKIDMNKGKLIQIMDNIFLNSEYWLKEDIRLSRLSMGTITIELAKPRIRISDNGRGIDPGVEASLFEPFVSAKGKGIGRGLGLYIVQQMLEAEGCSIRLMPLRNIHGRLFLFEIDLTGVLLDKQR